MHYTFFLLCRSVAPPPPPMMNPIMVAEEDEEEVGVRALIIAARAHDLAAPPVAPAFVQPVFVLQLPRKLWGSFCIEPSGPPHSCCSTCFARVYIDRVYFDRVYFDKVMGRLGAQWLSSTITRSCQ